MPYDKRHWNSNEGQISALNTNRVAILTVVLTFGACLYFVHEDVRDWFGEHAHPSKSSRRVDRIDLIERSMGQMVYYYVYGC